MWYSLEHNRRLKAKDVVKIYSNISFPASFSKGFTEITPAIAEVANLVPLRTPEEPEAGVDYDPDFQQPVLDFSQVTLNEGRTEALGTWVIHDKFSDQLDESGNILKTKEDIKKEVDEQQGLDELEFTKRQEQERITEAEVFSRGMRDGLLRDSDRYVTIDWPHETEEVRQQWVAYRQELRDLPESAEWPFVDFPESPESLNT